MKFKLDENLPSRAAGVLRDDGHDALMLLDQAKPGAPDSLVAELAGNEGRALITLDLDFADIRTYDPVDYPGIVVLRPRRADAPAVLRLVGVVSAACGRERLAGRLWIVEDDRIRMRGSSS